jgi:hypothetical protein
MRHGEPSISAVLVAAAIIVLEPSSTKARWRCGPRVADDLAITGQKFMAAPERRPFAGEALVS